MISEASVSVSAIEADVPDICINLLNPPTELGLVVPIPTLPLESMRIRSVEAVSNAIEPVVGLRMPSEFIAAPMLLLK